MSEQAYFAKHGVVWKAPVETKNDDGSSNFSFSFPVCTVTPEVGDEAAETIAHMLSNAEALAARLEEQALQLEVILETARRKDWQEEPYTAEDALQDLSDIAASVQVLLSNDGSAFLEAKK